MFSRRLALVVGVKRYATLQVLHNPVADAESMADELAGPGGCELFEGQAHLNVDGGELIELVTAFCEEVSRSDKCLAVVYFSGHGAAEVAPDHQALHYLLASDYTEGGRGGRKAALARSCQLEQHVLAGLGGAKAAVVLLDACRSAPALSSEPEVSRGWLGKVGAAPWLQQRNVFLGYACAPFTAASDGGQGLGAFTHHLMQVRALLCTHQLCVTSVRQLHRA